MSNVIVGTAFSLTLGLWRLRVNVSIEDTTLDAEPAREHDLSCEAAT